MKLLLSNFRCFTGKAPTEFIFEDGKLILLKGQSGTGKSTLLEAIKWCLYGNIRGIYPSGFTPSYGGDITGKSKTYITIECDDFTITRSQAPEQLRVYIHLGDRVSKDFHLGDRVSKDNELVQDSAQHYIESIFGNKNVWLASSFVKQNERCPLMTASNTERMSLLNEILFGSDITNDFENPDFYVEKIEANLEGLDKEITSQTAIFNNYYVKYVESLKNFTNPYAWTTMNQTLIQAMKEEAEKVKLQTQSLSETLIKVTKLEEKKKLLTERLQEFNLPEINLNKVIEEINDKSQQKIKTSSEIVKLKEELQIGVSNQTRFSTLSQTLAGLKQSLVELHSDESNLVELHSTELQLQMNTLKTSLIETQKRELNRSQLERHLENLKSEINTLELTLSKYENKNVDELKSIIINSETYSRLQNLHSKIANLGSMELLQNSCQESEISSERDRLTNSLHKARYTENLFKKYNINTDNIKTELLNADERIKFHEAQKEHLERFKLFKTLKLQEEELSKKIIPITESLTESEINEKITSIEARLGTPLKCPHCACMLEYKNNTLMIPDSEIISREEGTKEVLRLKQFKNTIIFNRDIEQKLSSVQTNLSLVAFDEEVVSKPVLSTAELSRFQGLIRDCSQLPEELQSHGSFNSKELEDKLISLNKLEEYYKLSNEYRLESSKFNASVPVKTELSPLREAINNIPTLENSLRKASENLTVVNDKLCSELQLSLTPSKEINELLNEVQKKYELAVSRESLQVKILNLETELGKIELKDITLLENKIKSKEEEFLQLTEELNLLNNTKSKTEEYLNLSLRLKETINEIITPSQEVLLHIENNQRLYEDYSTQYSQATYMLNLLESKNELESLQKGLITMTNKQTSLNKMKGIVLDVTNSALQDLVDNINNTTNNILDELFETGLSIELKLYKEMKGKQAGTKSKPYVNLTVSQNGNTFDLGAMSGGEAARISLALTIALAVIHPTPFLMLDEVMASLDMNLRENCIDVIKKYLIDCNSSRCVIDVEHLFIEGYYDNIIPLGCC